ncbi:MAG: hypothetical protein DHS20C21_07690 [Gemmatimonadota bacterium]|nr:MAG: hypothetical protein DHS20C21_07690 [Gemmatimonadota bacterium]
MRCAIVMILLLAVSSVGQAASIAVPGDYSSLLAALDAAVAGDSVLVGPGTWTARDTRVIYERGFPFTVTACGFPSGGVTIVGTEGATATIIDGEHAGAAGASFHLIFFGEQEGSGPLVLEGLTLTGAGGSPQNGGNAVASAYNDGLTIRSCRFTGNTGTNQVDRAAIGALHSRVVLEDCEFVGNQGDGGIIEVFDDDLTVRRCLFEGNDGGCVRAADSFVIVQDSQFIGNRGPGGGVCVDVTTTAGGFRIQRCLFAGNTAEIYEGGAVRVGGVSGDIEFCVFANDSCLASLGAGLWWEDCTGNVRNNTFVGCSAVAGGVAVVAIGSGWMTFANNIVAGSQGGEAVWASDAGSLHFGTGCNDFWSNVEGNTSGGWTLEPTDLLEDPLFCDDVNGNFTLQENSPALVGACGQIGALGEGCSDVSVDPTSWGRLKNYYRE